MAIRLRVLNGPLKGRFTPIKAGDVIGRGPNAINLNDPKVSSQHARLIENESGQILMMDLGSTNGIKVDGKRVKQLLLTPGLQFQIGQTFIKVEAGPEAEAATAPPIPEEPEIEVPPPEWPEYFQEFIANTRSKIKDKPRQLDPMPQMLQLKFLRGPQIDAIWNIGYGPRIIGRSSLDFPLYDDKAADLTFRVRPDGGKILIETPHSNLVQLNDRPISTEELKDGDLISIGTSLIQVSIKEM